MENSNLVCIDIPIVALLHCGLHACRCIKTSQLHHVAHDVSRTYTVIILFSQL